MHRQIVQVGRERRTERYVQGTVKFVGAVSRDEVTRIGFEYRWGDYV